MDRELFVAILLFSLLIGCINILDSIAKYKKWISMRELIQRIPAWKDTKKPLIWYIIWLVIEWLSLPGFIILAILGKTVTVILAPFFLTACYFVLIQMFFAMFFYIVKEGVKEADEQREISQISQNKISLFLAYNRDMTNKELILDSLIDDDECLTQIVEFFDFAEVDISIDELQKTLDEMVEEGYISINYNWQNEHDEYPYALTEKGKKAWKNLGI